MRVHSFRLIGIRCFEDTEPIRLSAGCNIFVGGNNAGKSTLLRALTHWQSDHFRFPEDTRPEYQLMANEIVLENISSRDYIRNKTGDVPVFRCVKRWKTKPTYDDAIPTQFFTDDEAIFQAAWPGNFVIPFAAKRKAAAYDQSVNRNAQSVVDGTFRNLYARIDRVASPGPPAHEFYKRAVIDILGVFIGTQSSANGKQAGYFYDDETFVPLDQMGDGVAEIVALIVDLSLAHGKLFVLEEPETNLHPRGLKALLELIRESSKRNQFVIATHSNIVVRDLASEETSKMFRVFRDGELPNSPSRVLEVERTPEAHLDILRELGYEFGDFSLHDAWLMLEESSAESVIRDVLIPNFAPKLAGRLRTFSAGGVGSLEPSVSEFQRLVTFVHLTPVYQDRLWVRADGDEDGRKIIENLQQKFPYLSNPRANVFSQAQFERFYPDCFNDKVEQVLSIPDKQVKRREKAVLLREVLDWTRENEAEALAAWAKSAAEQLELLAMIEAALDRSKSK